MNGSSDLKYKVLDRIGTATLIVDKSDGEIVYANNEMENLTYFTRDEIESKSIFDFFTKSDQQRVTDLLNLKAFEDQMGALGEKDLQLIRKSHGKTPVALFIYDTDEPNIKVMTIRDDTNIKAAEWRLAETQASLIESEKFRSLGVMAGGIAHEINNPLAIIQGVAEWIQEFPDVSPIELASMMEQVIGASHRIAGIVKGLRTFSKESDISDMAMVSAQSIIQDTLSLCKERMLRSNIQVEVVAPDEPTLLYCNSNMISQVLINLLNNAHDAVRDSHDPWIRIEVKATNNLVKIHVVDSGPGISDDIRTKIMEPFFTTKRLGQGAGLGLSLSRGIIESQAGELVYDHRSPNTRFTVNFPVPDRVAIKAAEEEAHRLEIVRQNNANKIDRSESCILIVDDEKELRRLLARRIQMFGFRTIEASCGEEALEKLEQHKVDVVLSDVRMANGDGFWLLEKINEMRSMVPVIFVTGSVNISIEELFNLGAQAVFHKPVKMKALEARLDELLYSRRFIWRRRQLRIPHRQPVKIASKITGESTYEVHSISRGGLFAAHKGVMPIAGELVQVEMDLKYGKSRRIPIKAEAIVRWVRDRNVAADQRGIGIELISFESDGKAKYYEYVNALYTENDLIEVEDKDKKSA